MCTVLLPPDVNPIAVKKNIISNQVLLSSSNLLRSLSSSLAHISTSAQCHPFPTYIRQWPRDLRLGSAAAPLLGCGFVCHRRLGFLSIVSVVCCQVESLTECGASECDREPSIMRRPWSIGVLLRCGGIYLFSVT